MDKQKLNSLDSINQNWSEVDEEIKKIIIISDFSTVSLNQHVNIYNHYKLHTVLSVRFEK